MPQDKTVLKNFFAIVFAVLLLAFSCFAQEEDETKKAEISKPQADIVNGKYGAHERNVFDLWKPAAK